MIPTAEEPRDKAAEPEQPRTRPDVPSARFEATVFQVEVPPDRIVELDAVKLAAAGSTPADMVKVLQEFGQTVVLYRVDHGITLDGRRPIHSSIKRDTPYVSGVRTSSSGEISPMVSRNKVGSEFRISGYLPDETNKWRVQVSLEIEIAALTDSVVEVGPDVTSPVFWGIDQSYRGLVSLEQPFVLLSVDGAATTGSGTPLAFVSLVKLSEPAE